VLKDECRKAVGAKRQTVKSFAEALELLEKYARPMARWEEDCLTRALACLACGNYAAAGEELGDFRANVAPSVSRELEVSRPARKYPLTLSMLWDGLASLQVT
jgi:hypothetical protein